LQAHEKPIFIGVRIVTGHNYTLLSFFLFADLCDINLSFSVRVHNSLQAAQFSALRFLHL